MIRGYSLYADLTYLIIISATEKVWVYLFHISMKRKVSTRTFSDSSEPMVHSIHSYFMASRLLLLPYSRRNLGSIFTDFNRLVTMAGFSVIAIRSIRPFQGLTMSLQNSLPSFDSQTCS
jgi:hypothetical protein